MFVCLVVNIDHDKYLIEKPKKKKPEGQTTLNNNDDQNDGHRSMNSHKQQNLNNDFMPTKSYNGCCRCFIYKTIQQ